jgi:hypothetical protein
MHLTYRHPTYKNHQPSGHFHQDELAITLAINKIPILVDPGSFVYTQNIKMRNIFRSKNMHNTFYIKQKTNLPDLFQLPRIEQSNNSHIIENEKIIRIMNCNHEYKKLGFMQHRTLTYYKQKKEIEITDWFTRLGLSSPTTAHWNFIFHPNIILKQINKNHIDIQYAGKKLLAIYSTLHFKIIQGFYSPEYGKISKCAKIFATQTLTSDKKEKTIFKYYKN